MGSWPQILEAFTELTPHWFLLGIAVTMLRVLPLWIERQTRRMTEEITRELVREIRLGALAQSITPQAPNGAPTLDAVFCVSCGTRLPATGETVVLDA